VVTAQRRVGCHRSVRASPLKREGSRALQSPLLQGTRECAVIETRRGVARRGGGSVSFATPGPGPAADGHARSPGGGRDGDVARIFARRFRGSCAHRAAAERWACPPGVELFGRTQPPRAEVFLPARRARSGPRWGPARLVALPRRTQSRYPRRRRRALRSVTSSSVSTPLGELPSTTPRIPRPCAVSATTTSTGFAVAQ